VWEAILHCKVRIEESQSLNYADYGLAEMKLAVAAIYTNFRTTIVNADNIEAIDAYTVKPTGDKLILKFESV
jgi:hypothetical protein